MHLHPIHLDSFNNLQTAATNVAPSNNEWARDASRAPVYFLLFHFLLLLTCIYNKSDHQRNSSRNSRGSRRVASRATGKFISLFLMYFTNIYYFQSLRETTTTKAPRNGKKGPTRRTCSEGPGSNISRVQDMLDVS
jgi:hypothetical protein